MSNTEDAVTMKLSVEQGNVMSAALDLYSRLSIGQLEELAFLSGPA